MNLRPSCDYLTGATPAPHLTPLVDNMIGTAFPTVKYVAEHMDIIYYLANNMEALVTLANGQASRIEELERQVAELQALTLPATPTIIVPPLSFTSN